MEKVGSWDQESVMCELTQGREFANQLLKELNPTATSSETSAFLMQRILSSYDNALTLLDYMAALGNGGNPPSKVSVFNTLESPVCRSGTSSDTDSEDQVHVSKKRKKSPKSSEPVRVCSGTGVENDGYNWRKYGQKDILGTNHPRAYFRCTHRHTRGCLATKQVQRTGEYPATFDVIYRGKHTCMQEMMKYNGYVVDVRKREEVKSKKPKADLKVETQDKHQNFLDFSFPTTPVECENMGMLFCAEPQSFVELSYSTPFMSPATSESYFSLSPRQMNDIGNDHHYLWSSGSDLTEIVSNTTPLVDFLPGDLDFLIDFVDFNTPLP